MLELLVPCPNAAAELGDNRDKFLFNSALVLGGKGAAVGGGGQTLQSTLTFLGKLIGMACRHNIMVPLSLPKLLWKPLVGERVNLSDLLAVDCKVITTSTLTSLLVQSEEQLSELLVQALVSASLHSGLAIDASAAKVIVGQALEGRAGAGTVGLSDSLVDLVETIQRLLLLSQSASLTALYRGLTAVIPCELLNMFSADEVEAMLCGQTEVDLEVLKKATVYESISPSDRSFIHTICLYV